MKQGVVPSSWHSSQFQQRAYESLAISWTMHVRILSLSFFLVPPHWCSCQLSSMEPPVVPYTQPVEPMDINSGENVVMPENEMEDLEGMSMCFYNAEAKETYSCWFQVQMPLFSITQWPVPNTFPVHDLAQMNVQCPHCQALHWMDKHVMSLSKSRPEFEMCCVHRKVSLPPLCMLPLPLANYKHKRAMTFTRTSCNIMLHLHSHPWGSRLTTLLLAVDCQFFVSMVNWHTWQDLYCLPTMCTCLIPSFTYMILMRHLAIVFLKMKTFLWIRWWSFNNSCEHVIHILHCISMHMKSCKGTMHLIIPSSFVSFQAMINNDTTCPWLMKLGSFYQGDYCDIVLHLCPEYYCNPADNCDHLWLQCINEGHVVYAPLYYVLFFSIWRAWLVFRIMNANIYEMDHSLAVHGLLHSGLSKWVLHHTLRMSSVSNIFGWHVCVHQSGMPSFHTNSTTMASCDHVEWYWGCFIYDW